MRLNYHIYLSTLSILLLIIFQLKTHSQNTLLSNKQGECSTIKNAYEKYINSTEFKLTTESEFKDSVKVDSVAIINKNKIIHIYFDASLAHYPIRPWTVSELKKMQFPKNLEQYASYTTHFHVENKPIQYLIPNYYQTSKKEIDKNREFKKHNLKSPALVTNTSKSFTSNSNLKNYNIALWASHGWYYEPELERWEWQRARLFNTVEDLYSTSYIYNYIIPMLENAGANIFTPRERHWQTNEVIVDNDTCSNQSIFRSQTKLEKINKGFKYNKTINNDDNPFKLGTSVGMPGSKTETNLIEYIPNIPEQGEYPVYVSYTSLKNSANQVVYKIYHSGGVTEFNVNQQKSGSTWVYLGNFMFKKGINENIGKVTVSNKVKNNKTIITSDAVRFGAGMGNIIRNGLPSERPRYQEAARYYLQYSGYPDSCVWRIKPRKEDDYADDLRSRGEWVNYLMGAPAGPTGFEQSSGLNIPIHLSLAFHTDAGITDNDTVIGTLGIYSTKEKSSNYPSGLSKIASRDLTDIIQTEIVNTIRTKYDKSWSRRAMLDKGYSEAYRANTPSILLELLSHQNLLDIRFGSQPSFQFDVSRAIYKGIVKFMSQLYKLEYAIQPLPVSNFATHILPNGNIELTWRATTDSLEASAKAEQFVVYTKINNNGFDNGQLVNTNKFIVENPEKGKIYTFKVTALNKGGESFDSEELSVGINNLNKQALIINAFDRLGGADYFNEKNKAGFLPTGDEGVAYMYDLHTVGKQYDFDKSSPWLDDDSPGWGASSAELEEVVFAGNTFNYSYIHGESLINAGISFSSASDEAVEQGLIELNNYVLIDFLAGEEKTTYMPKNDSIKHFQVFSEAMLNQLKKYTTSNGNLLISGAYIATDIHANKQDSIIADLFKYKWRTNNATHSGSAYYTHSDINTQFLPIEFNTKHNCNIYRVEAPDALEPSDSSSRTFLRYKTTNMSAAVIYKGNYKCLSLGFPFETITNYKQRSQLMQNILNEFELNSK